MSSPFTDEQIQLIYRLRDAGNTLANIAESTGISSRTIRRALSRRNDSVKVVESTTAVEKLVVEKNPIEEAIKRRQLTKELREEREQLEAVAGERSFRTFLEATVAQVAPEFATPPIYVPQKLKQATEVETMLLLLSDWHAYEVVNAERMMRMNEYNAAIMARRVHRVIHRVIKHKTKLEQGGGWQFPEIVVGCNGDFLSGTIHELERHTDAESIVAACLGAGVILAEALRDLAANFSRVRVICTSGNHGRLPDARRMQQKDPRRSWDTMVYYFAAQSLLAHKNIEFKIPECYSATFSIGDVRFLQNHGHEIKSWNSIPHYGIERFARNMSSLSTLTKEHIDYYLFGHFHSDSSMPVGSSRAYINGSLIGGNEFSLNGLGKCDRPMQKLLQVSEKFGVTAEIPIHAERAGETYTQSYTAKAWEHWT